MDMFFNCPLCNHNKCSKDTDNKTNSTHYNCEMCGGYVIQSGYYEKVNLIGRRPVADGGRSDDKLQER